MTDYKKMLCEDMKLFIFEWVILNPEEGKGIKYVRNLNKPELIKVCMYIDGKLSRDEMMEVIIAKQEHFRELARRRRDDCSDSSDSSNDSSSDSEGSDSSSDSEGSDSSSDSEGSLSSESSESNEDSEADA